MLQGIADEIGEHLDKTVGVSLHRGGHQRFLELQLHGVRTTELKQLLDILTHLVDIRIFLLDLDFTRFHSGEVENFIDQTCQALVVTLNNLIVLHAFLIGVRLSNHTRETLNSVQRGTDFMAHVGKEERFHLTGLFSLQSFLFVFLQLFVCNLQLLRQEPYFPGCISKFR